MSALKFDVSVVGELNLDLVLYGLPAEFELDREHVASDLRITLGSSSAIFTHNFGFWRIALAFIPRLATTRWANSVCDAWPKAVSTFRSSNGFPCRKPG
jgi:hypothetical protein